MSCGFPFEVPRSAATETPDLEMSLIRVSMSFNLPTCGFLANCCYQKENLKTDICDEIPASSPHLYLFKHYAYMLLHHIMCMYGDITCRCCKCLRLTD